jgi:hypothetical protein
LVVVAAWARRAEEVDDVLDAVGVAHPVLDPALGLEGRGPLALARRLEPRDPLAAHPQVQREAVVGGVLVVEERPLAVARDRRRIGYQRDRPALARDDQGADLGRLDDRHRRCLVPAQEVP